MIIDHNGTKFVASGTLRDIPRMEDISGKAALRKTEPNEPKWNVPSTVVHAKQLATDLPDAEWTDAARQARGEMGSERKNRLKMQREGERHFLDERLSPLQRRGVAWLRSGNGILADDMGSGKTVMACVAAERDEADTVLVITTKSTVGVWRDHLNDWTGITPFIFHGPKRVQAYEDYLAFEGRKALITTHALMAKHSARASFHHVAAEGEPAELNIDFDLGIVDEAHRAGLDPKSAGVRAFFRIGANCGARWALTGTPVNDVADDFWLLMAFVEPRVFGSRGSFRSRYCIMTQGHHGGYDNEGIHPDREEEFMWAMRPYFMRRLKREVVLDLPAPVPTQYITLELKAEQRKLYNQLKKNMMAELKGELLVAPDELALSLMLQYVADGIPVLDDEGNVIAMEGPSNKLDYILDIAKDRAGDPFVVYAYSSKTVDMLASAMKDRDYRVAKITGDVDQSTRDANVAAFQAGALDVIFLTDAGAEGITLTAADLLIQVRESWRAPVNQQVKDRIDRWGQERTVNTIVLLSEGTVDESRRTAVEGKVGMQEQILKDGKKLKAFLEGTWTPEEVF